MNYFSDSDSKTTCLIGSFVFFANGCSKSNKKQSLGISTESFVRVIKMEKTADTYKSFSD